jgi:hypothetical protein
MFLVTLLKCFPFSLSNVNSLGKSCPVCKANLSHYSSENTPCDGDGRMGCGAEVEHSSGLAGYGFGSHQSLTFPGRGDGYFLMCHQSVVVF